MTKTPLEKAEDRFEFAARQHAAALKAAEEGEAYEVRSRQVLLIAANELATATLVVLYTPFGGV